MEEKFRFQLYLVLKKTLSNGYQQKWEEVCHYQTQATQELCHHFVIYKPQKPYAYIHTKNYGSLRYLLSESLLPHIERIELTILYNVFSFLLYPLLYI